MQVSISELKGCPHILQILPWIVLFDEPSLCISYNEAKER